MTKTIALAFVLLAGCNVSFPVHEAGDTGPAYGDAGPPVSCACQLQAAIARGETSFTCSEPEGVSIVCPY